MSGLEWRYLPAGLVKHALRQSGDAGAACGRYVLPASEWRGTGSQGEHERVTHLRECRACTKALSR